jgi:acyl-coenzyme A thioesterase PaaI-like protein
MVPYTGALGARVQRLERGDVAISLADRHGVRNHLRSIHAIALANLAEFASGTAMLTALDPAARGIVVRFEMTYHKKARGVVTARAWVEVPPVLGPMELHPEAEVTDSLGDVVARARVTWRVEPRPGATPLSQDNAARDAARARA